MKLKTILVGSLILLIIFLIYLTTLDKLVYFLALGDSVAAGKTPYGNHDYSYNDYIQEYLKEKKVLEKYIDQFIDDEARTTDLIRDIVDNKKVIINKKEQSIKNALIKADLVTLSIGMNDLYYKLNTIDLDYDNLYKHIDEMMIDTEELFKMLREYCKEDIFVINYYRQVYLFNNHDLKEHFNYINKELKKLCNKYNIKYIEINNIIESNVKYMPNNKSFLITRSGQKLISDEVIKNLQNTLFKS